MPIRASFLTVTLLLASSCAVLAQSNGRDENSNVENPTQQAQSQQPLQRMDIKTFTGKITKHGNAYVLYDMNTNLVFELDNQPLAKKFMAKEVSVVGQLMPPGSKIHVQKIVRAQ